MYSRDVLLRGPRLVVRFALAGMAVISVLLTAACSSTPVTLGDMSYPASPPITLHQPGAAHGGFALAQLPCQLLGQRLRGGMGGCIKPGLFQQPGQQLRLGAAPGGGNGLPQRFTLQRSGHEAGKRCARRGTAMVMLLEAGQGLQLLRVGGSVHCGSSRCLVNVRMISLCWLNVYLNFK